MKKIKYLLGLLIVGVGLFINQSFGLTLSVDYTSQSNKNLSFLLGGLESVVFVDNLTVQPLTSFYRSFFSDNSLSSVNARIDSLLDISNYSYTGSFPGSRENTSISNIYGNSSSLAFLWIPSNNSSYSFYNGSVLFRLGGRSSLNSGNLFQNPNPSNTNYSVYKNGYVSIVGSDQGDNCFSVNTPNEGFCDPISYNVHLFGSPYTITDQGVITDSEFVYNGESILTKKGNVVYSIYNTYSFAASTGIDIILNQYVYFLRTIYRRSDSTFDTINGVMFMRLNNNTPVFSGQSFQILAISSPNNSTGGMVYDPTTSIYSLYTCPYTAQNVFSCVFNKGGYITGESTYVIPRLATNNQGRDNGKLVNNYDPLSDSVSIFSFTNNVYGLTGSNYLSFTLGSNEGFNVLDGLTPPDDPLPPIPDDPEDSTYSGSVVFDNCIETEVCWYSTGSDGLTTKYCTNSCVSSGAIESGSYIGPDGTIYYVDSSLDIGNLINGNTSYLFNTGYLDSDGLLSVDYYSGLFNGGGFKLGVCPYPKSEFFSFVTNIKIGGFYPFMPINCFYSAFIQGFKIHYFDDFGLFPNLNSQLINGNTHFHRTLYRFFDILLSIGLLLILSSLYRMIKK